jgi:CRP/FNR family transcriptional regulator, cAMP and macrophage regulator
MELKSALSMLRDRGVMASHAAWLARDFGRREMAPLTPSDVEVLSRTFKPMVVKAGTKLLAAMREPDAAYIVESGEVELVMRRGTRRLVLGIARAGDVVGDVPLLCNMAPPFAAVARTDATLLKLERAALQELLEKYPAISLRWLSSLVRRLEQAQRRIVALMVGDIRVRTIAIIAEELLVAGRSEVRLSQGEIASLLGATRQSVNRVLGQLGSEGLIKQEYGKIEVLDPDRILELAGAGGTG